MNTSRARLFFLFDEFYAIFMLLADITSIIIDLKGTSSMIKVRCVLATLVCLLLTSWSYSSSPVEAAVIQQDIFKDIELHADADASQLYDEYDAESEDMVLKHVPVEEPKPVSTFQYWLRRLGSPLLIKYLAFKVYVRSLWDRMLAKS